MLHQATSPKHFQSTLCLTLISAEIKDLLQILHFFSHSGVQTDKALAQKQA